MTFREKIELDDPYRLSDHSWGGVTGCPDRYDPECMDKCRLKGGPSEISCNSCWNREIPEEKEEKENKSMKKTKAMLEEELEQKRAEIEELKKELVKVEKYKQYDDMAGEIKAIYDSFVNAGFNEDQAYEILIILLQNQKAASNSWESYLSKYLSMRRK